MAEAGELEEAERAIRRAALFDPRSPGLELGFGQYLLSLDRWEAAEPHLRAAVERGGGSDAFAALLGFYLDLDLELDAAQVMDVWAAESPPPGERRERAAWRLRMGDAEGALEDLTAWLAQHPDDAEARQDFLRAAARAQRWGTALRTLEALSQAAPEEPSIWRDLAQVAAHVGHEPLAREAALRWDELAGEHSPEALMERARSALRREDAGEAGALLARLEALPPAAGPDPDRISLTAGLLALVGEEDAARAALHAGLEESPGDRVLALRLAEVEADAGEVEAAVAAVGLAEGFTDGTRARLEARFLAHAGLEDEAIARLEAGLASGEVEVALALAGMLSEQSRSAEAVEQLMAAERQVRSPPLLSARLNHRLAEALEADGRPEEAMDRALYALQVLPGYGPALGFVGRRYADRGARLDEAAAHLLAALEENPADAGLMDALARVYYQTGQLEEALRWLEQAAELAPGTPTIQEHLAEVLAALGRSEEAAELRSQLP